MDNKYLTKLVSGLPLSQKQRSTFASLLSQMTTLIESPTFEQSFTELTTTSERIKFVLSHEAVTRLIVNLISLVRTSQNNQKCATRTVQLVRDGSRAYDARRYEDSLASFSSAIRYAPQNDCYLPIALSSRFFAFYQLKQYEAALKDIEAAQSHPKYKAFLRMTIRECQCLVRLGRVAQAKQILDAIKRDDINKDDDALLKFYQRERENIYKEIKAKQNDVDGQSKEKDIEPVLLKNVSSVIKILSEKSRFVPQSSGSSLSSKVELRYDEKNGRHLATTEDVHFGDILAVTKPYAAVLTQKQELHFCHHCLTSLKPIPNIFPRTVPCTDCSRVLYCSEHCRTESWQEYHRFECALQLGNFFEMAIGDHSRDYRLALRTLFVAGGLESIARAVTQKLNSVGDSSESADFTHNPEDYFENVYRMPITKDANIKELIMAIIKAAFVFKWSNVATSEEDNIFAISTLLRHYLQNRVNYSFFVRRSQSALDEPAVASELIYTLDPLISLVRKSHHPNISINVIDCASSVHVTNVCALFALKPMPAGTVLSMAFPLYGDYRADVESFVQFRKELRTKLACPCEHCEERDNPLDSTAGAIDKYKFVSCGGFIRQIEADQANCCTSELEIDFDEDLNEMKKIFLDISKFHSEAIALVGRTNTLIDNDKEVLPSLSKEFSTLLLQLETLINERIAPLALKHSRLLLVNLYKQLNHFYRYCYFTMEPKHKFANLQKAWKYAEASHATLESHFGGDSLDLLVLLQKNVRLFSKEIDELKLGLMEPIGQRSGADGRSLEICLNLNDDTEDESRKARVCLIKSFQSAQKRLDKISGRYKMI